MIAGEVALKSSHYARQWSAVSRIIVHAQYDKETLHNDVALLEVSLLHTVLNTSLNKKLL